MNHEGHRLARGSEESPLGRSEQESLSAAGSVAGAEKHEAPPSAEDYSCPICLELLLRPVALSCGHHLCRGCWIRVIQGSHPGSLALTGIPRPWNYRIPCPLGRCQVRPIVRLDVALIGELESRFGPQLAARTAELHTLPEEERMAEAVNAWVAAGCRREISNNGRYPVTARAESEPVTRQLLVALVCVSGTVLLISGSPRFEPAVPSHTASYHTADQVFASCSVSLCLFDRRPGPSWCVVVIHAMLSLPSPLYRFCALARLNPPPPIALICFHRPQARDRWAGPTLLLIGLGTSCVCTSLACCHFGPSEIALLLRQATHLRDRRRGGGAQALQPRAPRASAGTHAVVLPPPRPSTRSHWAVALFGSGRSVGSVVPL